MCTSFAVPHVACHDSYFLNRYFAPISIFAQGPSNDSILIDISETWGIAVCARIVSSWLILWFSSHAVRNFKVELSRIHFDNGQRLYITLKVGRSMALKLFMLFMVISNCKLYFTPITVCTDLDAFATGLTTLVFIWITFASMFYKEGIISQLFVLPIGALFAFTAVRANAPGAPPGFGEFLSMHSQLMNVPSHTL